MVDSILTGGIELLKKLFSDPITNRSNFKIVRGDKGNILINLYQSDFKQEAVAPRIILERVVSEGNGGSGFRIAKNVDAHLKDIITRNNNEDGITMT